MKARFDPAKDEANIAKHGVSLDLAFEMDLETAAVLIDDRKDYGEPRYRAFGYIEGKAYCLVFAVRDGSARPISLRRAHHKEMSQHGV